MASTTRKSGKRSTTLHRSLLLSMVVLIAIISGGILAAVYVIGVKSTAQSGAMVRIRSTADTAEERLRLLSEGVRNHLVVTTRWGRAGLVSLDDGARLTSLFRPVVEKAPYVSAMMVADSTGREWHLTRKAGKWASRITDNGGRVTWTDSGEETSTHDVRDPRDQVWYLGAMNSHFDQGIYWTRPYSFGTSGDAGMTASIRCDFDNDGQDETVAAVDVRLAEISEFTANLYVSERGKIFVMTDDGALIGLPRIEGEQAGPQLMFSSVEQLGVPEISTAVERWRTAHGKRGEHFRFEHDGEHWWGGFRYFDMGANRTLWIGVVVPEADFRSWADVWRNYTLLITAAALGVAMLMATALARRYGRPLRLLAGESRRMRVRAERSGGESEVPFATESTPDFGASGIREIDALADDFQRMAIQVEQKSQALEAYSHTLEEKVAERTEDLNQKNLELIDTLAQLHETQQQLLLQEKMASLGNLVAGVAHEINSPIGAMNGAADVSRRCFDKLSAVLEQAGGNTDVREDPEFRKTMDMLIKNNALIVEGGHRVGEIVKNLRSFARLDEAELQAADLHEGLDSTLSLAQHTLKDRIEVIKHYGNIPKIKCYPNQLNQVFMNLFVNAAQAIDGKGKITITTSADSDHVRVKVADTGRGIPAENLGRVFEPGYTTKGVGVGTGLGLSISHRIVAKHGGTIYADSEPGVGTEMTISLPIHHDSLRGDTPPKEV